MSTIRPLANQDIPNVAALHWRVFSGIAEASDNLSRELQAEYERYFQETFLEHPWFEQELSSMVYEEDSGRISGFLGVVPLKMVMNGKHIRAAICSQFIVDPARRSTFAGVRLLKSVFDGPQDLLIADEANDQGRKLWEGLGGRTSLLYSLHWIRPLRPGRLALHFLKRRKALAPFAPLASPLMGLVDLLATRIPQNIPACRDQGEECSEDLLADGLASLVGNSSLRPERDVLWVRWVKSRVHRLKKYGTFRSVSVRNQDGSVAGWYLYYRNRNGFCNVLQVAGAPDSLPSVLSHMISSACREGAAALVGRLQPQYLQALSEKHCFFHRRGPWVLVHSRQPEILRALSEGDAFLSRLEGEWCLRFQ